MVVPTIDHCDLASLVITIRYPYGVNAAVHEVCGLLQKGGGEDDNTGCTVANLVILRFGKLHKQLRDMICDLHLAQNSRAIVCDCDIAVRGDEDLVKTARALLPSVRQARM